MFGKKGIGFITGFDHGPAHPFKLFCGILLNPGNLIQAPFLCQSVFITDPGQTQIGIVFPEQQPVFGPGCEHAVGLFGAAGDKVIHHDPNIGLGPIQNKRRTAKYFCRSIGPGPQPLGPGLLIAGCAVDLSGQEQPLDFFGFKGGRQFQRRYIIVFNGIGRAHDLCLLKAFYRTHDLVLDLKGQTVAQSRSINFLGAYAFIFQDHMVGVPLRKFYHLVFKGWAVPGGPALDMSAVQG